MALLPAENLLDGTKTPATTTSEMKGALGMLRRYLADLLGTDSTDKAAARSALGAAPVVSTVLTKNVAGNADIALLPIEALNDMLIFTGALTGNIAVVVPNTAKAWKVWNKTTGAFVLTLKTAAGAGVAIAQGKKRDLWCDGSDVLAGLTDFSDNPVPAIPIVISKRHWVQYGPMTTPTAGNPAQPDLVPQSQIGNSLAAGFTLKCSAAPTLFSVANGYNADGSDNNLNWLANVDIAVPNIPGSSTIYGWVDAVAKTAGFVTVADSDQPGGAMPTAAGKYTYDSVGKKMYLGTGTQAVQSNRMIVVELDTSPTAITAVRVRPYGGEYEGDFTATLPAAGIAFSRNHNFGSTSKISARLEFECTANDNGWVVGDRMDLAVGTAANLGYLNPANITKKRNIFTDAAGSATAWIASNPTSGNGSTLTQASWKWRFVAECKR